MTERETFQTCERCTLYFPPHMMTQHKDIADRERGYVPLCLHCVDMLDKSEKRNGEGRDKKKGKH